MKIFKKINQNVQLIVNSILLCLVYFLGIGITAIVAKIARKHFLKINPKKTSWQKVSGSKDLNTTF